MAAPKLAQAADQQPSEEGPTTSFSAERLRANIAGDRERIAELNRAEAEVEKRIQPLADFLDGEEARMAKLIFEPI